MARFTTEQAAADPTRVEVRTLTPTIMTSLLEKGGIQPLIY
jgi:hypothetical protein